MLCGEYGLEKQKTSRMWSYSVFSLEEFCFFICVEAKPAPIATPTPMPNAILFRDTPIAIPIASLAHHTIKLRVKLFITLYL